MAESLDDGEFWLPPQFLTDDDILMDMTNSNFKEAFELETEATKSLFPFEFPYGFGAFVHSSSDLSSPVESVVGSTETESDEEDYITGLTRQIAHSTLGDDVFATKSRFVSGSPQSTLCVVGRGCGCRQSSSKGSPNCQSQVSSPPETWDLLYAAAGEVARMRMNEESYVYQHNRGLLGPPRKPSPISVPIKNHYLNFVDAAGSIYSHHQHQKSVSHQKLQATQFQQLKQQQMMKHHQGSSVWGGPQTQSKPNGLYQVGGMNRVMSRNSTNNIRPLDLSPSAWPPLQHATTQQPTQQQQNGSGMRAVFLGAPGAKRESVGTGVFLPRRINTPSEPRKKSVAACSTVLLPAKVVQALNLNFDDKGVPFHPRFGSYMPESDSAALRSRNGVGVSYQKRNLRPQQAMNHEIRLPQEWTY